MDLVTKRETFEKKFVMTDEYYTTISIYLISLFSIFIISDVLIALIFQ